LEPHSQFARSSRAVFGRKLPQTAGTARRVCSFGCSCICSFSCKCICRKCNCTLPQVGRQGANGTPIVPIRPNRRQRSARSRAAGSTRACIRRNILSVRISNCITLSPARASWTLGGARATREPPDGQRRYGARWRLLCVSSTKEPARRHNDLLPRPNWRRLPAGRLATGGQFLAFELLRWPASSREIGGEPFGKNTLCTVSLACRMWRRPSGLSLAARHEICCTCVLVVRVDGVAAAYQMGEQRKLARKERDVISRRNWLANLVAASEFILAASLCVCVCEGCLSGWLVA